MSTISRTTTTTTFHNVTSNSAATANQMADLTQALNDLAATLKASSGQPAVPAQSQDGMMQTTQAPVNLSSGMAAPKQMDAYGAAQALKNHFSLMESAGTDGKGANSGDGEINKFDLEQMAKPGSGAPAELQQAARFLLDHPAMIESLAGPKTERSRDDLGALGLKLGAVDKEHAPISKGSLDKFLANAPASASTTPAANPNLMPMMSASMMSQLGQLGNTGVASAPKQAPSEMLAAAPSEMLASAPAPQALGGLTTGTAVPKQMDAYGAAQALKNHFSLMESAGTDGKGANSGDGEINKFDLEQMARPDSGAPAELQQAARFLLDHPAMIESLAGPKTERSRDDLGALGLKLGMVDKEHAPISKGSLDKFLANAPTSASSTPAAKQNLMPMMSASLMSQLGRMG